MQAMLGEGSPVSMGERLYRVMLFAYPIRFRRQYGAEMLAFARARSARAAGSGERFDRVRVWWFLLRDLSTNAFAALVVEHGVRELWTLDRDFQRFPGVRAIDPFAD